MSWTQTNLTGLLYVFFIHSFVESYVTSIVTFLILQIASSKVPGMEVFFSECVIMIGVTGVRTPIYNLLDDHVYDNYVLESLCVCVDF